MSPSGGFVGSGPVGSGSGGSIGSGRDDDEERWRRGARSAFAVTFDVDAEEVWIGADSANAHRPGVLSQGTYGAKVGVLLVLDLLERLQVSATFFVPGRVAERYPDRVREIVAGGHELAHHGYTHTHPGRMTPEQEAAEFAQALQVLSGFGVTVAGYRSPAWDFSPATMDILRGHGLLYSSNLMDDIRPYRHPEGIVELPVQWILDDAPHFWFSNADWTTTIRSAREVLEIWQEEAAGIHRLGGLCVLALHPQLIGRPGRIDMLERFLRGVLETGEVRIATCEQIARDVP
jgi:peptidoglycan-N-acetylglucosamine deacetylase